MAKSLLDVIAAGARRPVGTGVRSMLQSWLGVPVTLQNHDFWSQLLGNTWGGRRVSHDQALQLSTVWACVRLIAETIASLPLELFIKNPDGSRTVASKHPLYEILHNQPNADMSAVSFWEAVLVSMLMWGNAFVEVRRSGATVIALNFLIPARVTVKRLSTGAYEYRYLDPDTGQPRTFSEVQIMHIPAFSLDGIFGLSPVVYGAQVFGSASETEKAAYEVFADALRSPGLVKMDGILKASQREDIRRHVNEVSASGGVMVLEKGAGFEKIGFDPLTAQMLATRQFNVEEICRWFGVDPVMVGQGGKDSNWGTGLEQKLIWFITFVLRKWSIRIEKAIRKSLLTPVERISYYAEFTMEGLLRGDSASRAAFYSTMTQNGIFTRDDCRELENRARMGGNAAVLTVQSNMMPIDKLGADVPGDAARTALLALLGIEPTAAKAAPTKEP